VSADVIARVRALAADFESRGDFATASDLLALCTAYAQVTAERDAAKEAFDNLSTLQQADRKELLDTRGQLATLRADLAAQVEGMLTDVPDRHSGTRREDFIRTRNRTLHRVIRILRGPHAD